MKHIILGAAALVLSAAASAENYIGATIGASHIDIDCGVSTHCDSGDTGFKIYGGIPLQHSSAFPSLSLEVAYIDFGAASTGILSPVYNRKVEVSALTFGAALRGKFTPALSGVGRLGLGYVNAKATGSAGPFLVGSSSSSSLKLHAGLGLEFAFDKQFKLVGAADFTGYDTGNETGSANLLSIGLQYGF